MRDIEIENKWVGLILACRGGSQTVQAFCLEQGLKFHSYYYWLNVLEKRRPGIFAQVGQVSQALGGGKPNSKNKVTEKKNKVSERPGFARVNFVPGSQADVEIVLPNNFRLSCSEDINSSCLENILSVLEARSC